MLGLPRQVTEGSKIKEIENLIVVVGRAAGLRVRRADAMEKVWL